tara:strand:- start:14720 stop:14950 length:231 start_codon:yes stop_codon:yes gene_type:complete
MTTPGTAARLDATRGMQRLRRLPALMRPSPWGTFTRQAIALLGNRIEANAPENSKRVLALTGEAINQLKKPKGEKQ